MKQNIYRIFSKPFVPSGLCLRSVMISKWVKHIAGWLLLSAISFPAFLLETGCANIIPPAGGPRDSLPPVLLKASPADSSKNFRGNRITLSFDEYVDIQNVQQNLIVSPVPKALPAVDHKLSTITIKLRDSLEPGTTYTLNFGDAIRDINEGNILKNFVYIFSTGSSFDSLQLKGQVILAETGGTDTTLIVMLHRSGSDSAIVKEKPRYVTRLDGKGNFTFRNLPAGTFYLYAMKDESNSYRFSGRDQLFAFAGKPVVISQTDTISHILYAFPDNEGASPAAAKTTKGAVSKEKRLIIQNNLDGNRQDLLNDFTMKFEVPLKYVDTSKLVFTSDSSFTPLSGYTFTKDSSGKALTLHYPWKENTLYNLILDKDFAEDTLGRKLLKTDTLRFTSKQLADYGSVRIRFRNLDMSKNPVLQFVQNDQVIKSFPLAGPEFYQQLFVPGDYELRILNDDNKNGRWDPGIFMDKHQQPEIVQPVPSGKINIKPSWENEFEREAPAGGVPR
ncbi:MAG TPA: Ig-like domain-containing protein [Chitinophagaceae bacterium]|jgi:hypothetical protein|nr:Ig-like domain-containing protein [Chitinophagaceae bacterium]